MKLDDKYMQEHYYFDDNQYLEEKMRLQFLKADAGNISLWYLFMTHITVERLWKYTFYYWMVQLKED